jgi:hypothetical protein
MPGVISKDVVKLKGLSPTDLDDLDMPLAGPAHV